MRGARGWALPKGPWLWPARLSEEKRGVSRVVAFITFIWAAPKAGGPDAASSELLLVQLLPGWALSPLQERAVGSLLCKCWCQGGR